MIKFIEDITIAIGISLGFCAMSYIILDGIKNKRDWLYFPKKRNGSFFMPYHFSFIRRLFGIRVLEIYLKFWAVFGLLMPFILGGYLILKYR